MSHELPDLLTVQQVATLSGYCPATIRRFIAGGELEAVRRGKRGHYRVTREAYLDWIATMRLPASTSLQPSPLVSLPPRPKHDLSDLMHTVAARRAA